MYKCAICGKDHERVEDYVACSERCMRSLNAEKERKRKEKLAEEREPRYKAILDLQDKIKSDEKMLADAKDKYIRDYPEDKRVIVEDVIDGIIDRVFVGW